MTLERVGLPPPHGEGYPWSLPLLRSTRSIALNPRTTLLVGENGGGTSTLRAFQADPDGFLRRA